MRIVQRASAAVAWLAILGVGLLLTGEGTGLLGGAWRQTIADVTEWIDRPPIARWAGALLGVLAGLVGLVVLVAQFVPVRLSGRSSVVDQTTVGSTRVTGAAVRRAVSQRLDEIPGVATAAPVAHRRRLVMDASIGEGADAEEVAREVRTTLNEEFWDSLGTGAIPVDVHLRFVPVVVDTEQEKA